MGYEANTQAMADAGRAIGDGALAAQEATKDIAHTNLLKSNFGRLDKHQEKLAGYQTGLTALGDGAKAFGDALLAYSEKLDTSGKAYVRTDSANASNLK
jgi:hypothetical protein